MNFAVLQLAVADYSSIFGHQWQLAEPKWLLIGWAAPVVVILILIMSMRSNRRVHAIADAAMIESLAGCRRRWTTWAHSLISISVILLLSIALSKPQSDPKEIEVESRGRDVVFLVDVSRSMLARDVSPSRLEKAKLWIHDLVDELGSDRVGLVAFAGSSSVLSPLTNDRLFFRLALEELSPESVFMGGTNIGDAIRRTMDLVFVDNNLDAEHNYRDIILISDGEDQESLPVEAARIAGAAGVRVIAIGIGSEIGAAVPPADDADSSASPAQRVQTRLESGTLKTIAAASPGGVYLEVGTGTVDLASVYKQLISSAEQQTFDTSTKVEFTEQYFYFISLALALILIETLFVPTRMRRSLA